MQLIPTTHTPLIPLISYAIKKTVTQDKYLGCFEKNALGNNLPSQKTIPSFIMDKWTNAQSKGFYWQI